MSGLPPLEHFAEPPIEVFRRFPVGRALRKSPPSAQWLLEGYIPLGVPGGLVGRPNCGKSMFTLQLCVAVAAGVPFLGHPGIGEPSGVLYVSMEDGFSSLHHRLSRLADHTGLRQKRSLERRVGRNLRILCPDLSHGSSLLTLAANRSRLIQECKSLPGGGRLVVLDTQSALFDGEENNTADASAFWAECQAISQETGATVLVLHHVRKASSSDRLETRNLMERLNPENTRGNSAIEGRARFLLTMASLLPKEASKVGLSEDNAQREAFVVVSSGKQNDAAKGNWFLLERGAPGTVGAGLLDLHPQSGDLVARLRGTEGIGSVRKSGPSRALLALQSIAFAGELAKVNRDSVLACLWPGEPTNMKRWYKLVEGLREKGWLKGDELTDLGRKALLGAEVAEE